MSELPIEKYDRNKRFEEKREVLTSRHEKETQHTKVHDERDNRVVKDATKFGPCP